MGSVMSQKIPAGAFQRPAGTVPLQDTSRFKGRFGVWSSDNKTMYIVSFDTAARHWACGCLGAINNGKCKHMDRYGLRGRQYKDTYGPLPIPIFAPAPADAESIPEGISRISATKISETFGGTRRAINKDDL